MGYFVVIENDNSILNTNGIPYPSKEMAEKLKTSFIDEFKRIGFYIANNKKIKAKDLVVTVVEVPN
jgi:hypothetical protein